MADSWHDLNVGQEEYFELQCSACKENGLMKEAGSYCKNCFQYLCSSCLKSHSKCDNMHKVRGEKVERGKSELEQGTGIECAEHSGQTVSMYCELHDDLCCPYCAFFKHTDACKPKMSYIPDVAKGIMNGADFKAVNDCNDSLISSLTTLVRERTDLQVKLTASREECTRKIEGFYKELAQHLKTLKEDSIKEMNNKHDAEEHNIKEDINICTDIKKELRKMKQQLNPTGSVNESLLFVNMKKCNKSLVNYEGIPQNLAAAERLTFEFSQNYSLHDSVKAALTFGDCNGVIQKSTMVPKAEPSIYLGRHHQTMDLGKFGNSNRDNQGQGHIDGRSYRSQKHFSSDNDNGNKGSEDRWKGSNPRHASSWDVSDCSYKGGKSGHSFSLYYTGHSKSTCNVTIGPSVQITQGITAYVYRINAKITIKIYDGSIEKVSTVDAVVSSADKDLKPTGVIANALEKAGGKSYESAVRKMQKDLFPDSKQTGEVAVSGGGDLKVNNVIHLVSKRVTSWKDIPVFKTGMANVLTEADTNRYKSIALPLIGTGGLKDTDKTFSDFCEAFVKTICEFYTKNPDPVLKEIHLVNHSNQVCKALNKAFGRQTKPHPLAIFLK